MSVYDRALEPPRHCSESPAARSMRCATQARWSCPGFRRRLMARNAVRATEEAPAKAAHGSGRGECSRSEQVQSSNADVPIQRSSGGASLGDFPTTFALVGAASTGLSVRDQRTWVRPNRPEVLMTTGAPSVAPVARPFLHRQRPRAAPLGAGYTYQVGPEDGTLLAREFCWVR